MLIPKIENSLRQDGDMEADLSSDIGLSLGLG